MMINGSKNEATVIKLKNSMRPGCFKYRFSREVDKNGKHAGITSPSKKSPAP